jgi:phospholipid/cholesterol/gamma-HCH transport system substrate-binding protein
MAKRQSISWAELRVGLLVIASFGLLALAIFYISGEGAFFQPRITITAYFSSANGMKSGAEVRVEGVTAGNVRSVQITDDPDPNRFVEIEMGIDERYTIPSDSSITIGTIGLLGDSIVSIARGEAVAPPLTDGGTIQGQDAGEIRDVIQGADDVLANFGVLTDQFIEIAASIDQGEGTLGLLLNDDSIFESAAATMEEARQLVEDARTADGTIGRFIYDPEIYVRVSESVAALETIVENIENGEGTIGLLVNDRDLYDRFDTVLASFEELVEGVRDGEGTIGRLINDPTMYENMSEAAANVNTMAASITDSEGTIGRLINDPSMYDNMNQTVSEVLKLIYDFRQDPGRFLTINFRLF